MKKVLLFVIGLMIYTTNYAQVWRPQDLGYGTKVLGMRDLSIVNANTVWVTSYDGFYPFVTNRLEFSRTLNGGTTWIPGVMNFDTAYTTTSIAAISATEAWTSTYKNTGGAAIFHTTDGGLTWPQSGRGVLYDDNSFANFITFKDSMNGVTVGDPNNGYYEIYKTTNRGTNWTRIAQNKIPATLANNEYGTTFFAATKNSIWFGSTNGRIIYSHDFGNTWSASTVFTGNGFFNRLAFRDSLNGICIVSNATTSGVVYSTTNGGASWTLQPNNRNLKPGSLCAIPGTKTYLSCTQGRSPNWGTSISNDDGQTWIELEALNSRNTVAFFDRSTGWCGGFSGPNQLGGIFKYNGMPLPVNEIAQKAPHIIAYPNPVAQVLNIDMANVDTENGQLFITMSDVLGKVVFKEIKDNKTVNKTLSINMSVYTEGVYFLTVYDGKNTISREIIKKNN